MTTPSSQKAGARPIGFMLYDDSLGSVIAQMNLIIRPEDLSRKEPSRVAEHQTLGGAWADDFGQGVTQIEISGHTGWRGNQRQDGQALFRALHHDIFCSWYAKREDFAQSGKDPDQIQLIFTDELDGYSEIVAPRQFVLKRHKARPLLSQYTISMFVLGPSDAPSPAYDPITDAIDNPYGRYSVASIGLQANVDKQVGIAKAVNAALGDIAGAANAVLGISNKLLGAVLSAGGEVAGVFDAATAPLLYTAIAMQKAARNAFWVLATPYGVLENAKYTIMQIAANFNEAYCLLLNGFNLLTRIPDFEDIFGASNCSSTGGGRPLAPFGNDNPFLRIFNSTTSPISINASAANSIAALNQDMLAVNSTQGIAANLRAIADGVALA